MTRAAPAAGAALSLALALGAPVVADAQTESRFSTDASVTAGYSNNPFTTFDGNNGTALVTLDIAPRYQLLTPRSTITLSGDANIQQYLRRYGHNDSYLAALDYIGRLSEHTTAHARLDLSSAVLGAFNGALPLGAGASFAPVTSTPVAGSDAAGTGIGAGTPASTTLLPITSVSPLTPYTDVGLFGTRSRRRTARGSGDMSFTVSPRDSLSVSAYGEVTRYGDFRDGDYEGFGGSVGYQRRLSDRLSAGLYGSAATYNYHGNTPDSRFYSIQATVSARLSDRWSADGAFGVSFVDGGYGGAGTSPSGSINLCRRGPNSNMCAQVARQVAPTGIAGSQYVTTAGLTWNRRLDEHQDVSLSGSYSKVGSSSTTLVGPVAPVTAGYPLQTEYAQATAGYSRQLRARLRAVASLNYRQLLGDGYGGLRRPVDYGGQVGLSYRFGDTR